MSPDLPLRAVRVDLPDVDEEDVPIDFASRRAVEPSREVDVAFGIQGMEGIGPVGPVMDGETGGPGGGDRREDGQRGRPVGPEDIEGPGRGERGQGQGRGGSGREAQGLGRGDTKGQGGGEEEERERARLQLPASPRAWAPWLSRASRTRWLRILIPSGMARSSGLKLGLWSGAIVGRDGSFTPRKK